MVQPNEAAQHGLANEHALIGQRLRDERKRQAIGVRELSRRLGVSASLISQIELGRANPSVATLYSIVNELDLSLDELFAGTNPESKGTGVGSEVREADSPEDGESVVPLFRGSPFMDAAAMTGGSVVRRGARQMMHLGSGVTWERMNVDSDPGVDFLYVTYDVGGESAPKDALMMRHQGREYGFLVDGELNVTVGYETHELKTGDSVSFQSSVPHRLWNPGKVPARAVWCVVGRDDSH